MKLKRALPWLLLVAFALTRIPGLMPPNFSAAYGLMFCAGVYFAGQRAWWMPLAVMGVTDLLLLWHYGAGFWQPHMLVNYAAYAGLIGLGKCFKPSSSWLTLLGGGMLGAILFYLLTNTAAWFFNPFRNPEYTKDLAGWIIALTKGTAGYPQTWEFFRNTMMSGGLFAGLFAGAMKLSERLEDRPAEDEEEAGEPDEAPETEEAKA